MKRISVTVTILCLCLSLVGSWAGSAVSPARAQRATLRLDNLRTLPQAQPTEVIPLRLAVIADMSPQEALESYTPLLAYLSRQLDRPIEVVQRRSESDVNALIHDGMVEVAFVRTSTYIIGHREFGLQLLVAPQVHGESGDRSYLIAQAASPAQGMADLKGKVFAFTDSSSITGRAYPVNLVRNLGDDPDAFFARTIHMQSHNHAIHAVAAGLADGTAVDSVVYDYALAREPQLAEKVRVIDRSPVLGIGPVVVGPDVSPTLRNDLIAVFTGMVETEEGRSVLESLGFDGFTLIDDRAYDSARALLAGISQ